MKAFILGPDGMLRQADKYDGPLVMAEKSQVQFHVMIKITISAFLLGERKCSSDHSTLNWNVRRRLCGTSF